MTNLYMKNVHYHWIWISNGYRFSFDFDSLLPIDTFWYLRTTEHNYEPNFHGMHESCRVSDCQYKWFPYILKMALRNCFVILGCHCIWKPVRKVVLPSNLVKFVFLYIVCLTCYNTQILTINTCITHVFKCNFLLYGWIDTGTFRTPR